MKNLKNNKNIVILVVIIVIILAGFLYVNKNDITIKQTPKKEHEKIADPIKINEVQYTNNGFDPKTINIKKGETVRWTNSSSSSAVIASDPPGKHDLNKDLNLGEIPPGFAAQAVFSEPGTFGYYNISNPSQTGQVVVK